MLARSARRPSQLVIRTLMTESVGVCVFRAPSRLTVSMRVITHPTVRPRWWRYLVVGDVTRRPRRYTLVEAIAQITAMSWRRQIAVLRVEISLAGVEMVVRRHHLRERLRSRHVTLSPHQKGWCSVNCSLDMSGMVPPRLPGPWIHAEVVVVRLIGGQTLPTAPTAAVMLERHGFAWEWLLT